MALEHNNIDEVIEFARVTMGAHFPLMEKCKVNGPDAHELWKHLRRNTPEFFNKQTGKIKNIPWMWTKFYVDVLGRIVAYQHPRESIYLKIDLIEEMIGVR